MTIGSLQVAVPLRPECPSDSNELPPSFVAEEPVPVERQRRERRRKRHDEVRFITNFRGNRMKVEEI